MSDEHDSDLTLKTTQEGAEVIPFDPNRPRRSDEQRDENGELRIDVQDRWRPGKPICMHFARLVLDEDSQTAECSACGTVLSPWNALLNLSRKQHRRRMWAQKEVEHLAEVGGKITKLVGELASRVTQHRLWRAEKLLAKAGQHFLTTDRCPVCHAGLHAGHCVLLYGRALRRFGGVEKEPLFLVRLHEECCKKIAHVPDENTEAP